MYSRMRGGLRGSVGVSAPYDRVAGLVGHSHAMTEWTMLGQETPPRVCVWPGRLHLRRSVKAAAYPKKFLPKIDKCINSIQADVGQCNCNDAFGDKQKVDAYTVSAQQM